MDYRQFPQHHMLCIDMKSFYASVECRDRGWDPMSAYLAVVGDRDHSGSVILAASPRLKKDFNIRTGNRLYQIPDDPRIHVVNARMGHYLEQSMEVLRLFQRFAPLEAILPYSIDEAWVTVDGMERLMGDAPTIARHIRNAIAMEFGLPACVGIGPNRFLAKVILDIEGKSQGIAQCGYEDVPRKLWPVPVGEVWGIGSRLREHLYRMGIRTMGHLAQTPLEQLEKRFGVMGNQLYYHAWGVDLSPVIQPFEPYGPQKSIGHGITLLRDYEGGEVATVLLELSEEVAMRSRQNKKVGRTIQLGVGYSKESGGGFQRAYTIPFPTNVTHDIFHTAWRLFQENYNGSPVRRLSLALQQLEADEAIQLSLFDDFTKKKALGAVMDQIRQRYGKSSVMWARSLSPGGVFRDRSHKIGGHWQ